MHGVDERGRRDDPGGDLDEPLDLGTGQPAEDQSPSHRQAAQHLRERMLASELPLPVGGEDQDPGIVQLARQEIEEKERGLVGPVDVVEDQDHRAPLGGGAKELCRAAEEAEPRVLRRNGGLVGLLVARRELR